MMDDYQNRNFLVTKGNSTVLLNNGKYKVQDFITTYHPDGELPPQFRYVRNLMLDFNVRFAYYLLEQQYVVNHVIANDEDFVTAEKVIKPKIWKGVINNMVVSLIQRGLIADAQFTQDSITVSISSVNPDRLDSFFKYKRTGVARISATVAQAGFNFGNI
jgi:phage tail sheath gpL-like